MAVVRLDTSREAMGASHPIQWCEVVPVSLTDGADRDFDHRAKGRLALRPLTKVDIGILDAESRVAAWADAPPLVQVGGRVAVIDLRVFVPEVVSVLGTIYHPDLDANLSQIPFVRHLIGSEAPPRVLALAPGASCKTAITEAIHTSEMDVLKRLTPPARSSLCADLAVLGEKANLYGTQLSAFVEALRCSLHCTQGPPGTGKVRMC